MFPSARCLSGANLDSISLLAMPPSNTGKSTDNLSRMSPMGCRSVEPDCPQLRIVLAIDLAGSGITEFRPSTFNRQANPKNLAQYTNCSQLASVRNSNPPLSGPQSSLMSSR